MTENATTKPKGRKKFAFRLSRRAFSYPYILFLMIFVVVPLVLILVNAFIYEGGFSLKNFADFFNIETSSGLDVLWKSIVIGLITTAICLIIGYPLAYILSKMKAGKLLILFFVLPMWINFLIRTLATKAIFESIGIPLGMGTVIFGMVYNYLPFMILPLYNSISSIDKSYSEAALDLGADKMTVIVKTILPLSFPGILSGITMVFIPAISTFAITEILSDRQIYLFGDSIQNMFSQNMYGVGSVMSLVMLVLVLISNFILNRFGAKDESGSVVL